MRHLILAAGVLALASTASAQTDQRPNFVVFLIDDMRADDYGAAGAFPVETPSIDRLAREGMRFVHAFAAQPLCSPSRASFLTGLYPHNHGIVDNTERGPASHKLRTFPQQLQAGGYETAYIGKWHMGEDDAPRPGFDYWAVFRGQGSALRPILNMNGARRPFYGYVTDILTDRAVEFLQAPRKKPFLLYLAHKQVHPNTGPSAIGGDGYIPAERHRGKYADLEIKRRPNAAIVPRDKPALMRKVDDLPQLGVETQTTDEEIRLRWESMLAIDESIGRVRATLAAIGQLENTVIVFAGDNGYFYGEHGLSFERRLAYEESAGIPLVIRFPSMVKPGTVSDALVLNVDVAPTLLDLARIRPSSPTDGRSLVPLLSGKTERWRNSILIEHFNEPRFPRTREMGYQAVRTRTHKYIRYVRLQGMDELYDLTADPFELNNLAADPAHASRLKELQTELDRLLKETGASPGSTPAPPRHELRR